MPLTGKIVFASGRAAEFDIWSLSLSTGELLRLTHEEALDDYPRWSPDGRSIAYISTGADSVPSLHLMDADGRNKRRLTHNIFCQQPSWSPSGDMIIFSGNGVDSSEISICGVRPDGSALRQLYNCPGIETSPCFSPDGGSIIFAATASDPSRFSPVGATDIFELHLASKEIHLIQSHPAIDGEPRYSPDGTRIAFTSHRNGASVEQTQALFEDYRAILRGGTNAQGRKAMAKMKKARGDADIYVCDRNGDNLSQITNDDLADRGICWSPCSNYIMYSQTDLESPESDRLRIINAHSGEEVPFEYNRTALEEALGASGALNRSLAQMLTPDFLERHSVDPSFWGLERHPDWAR